MSDKDIPARMPFAERPDQLALEGGPETAAASVHRIAPSFDLDGSGGADDEAILTEDEPTPEFEGKTDATNKSSRGMPGWIKWFSGVMLSIILLGGGMVAWKIYDNHQKAQAVTYFDQVPQVAAPQPAIVSQPVVAASNPVAVAPAQQVQQEPVQPAVGNNSNSQNVATGAPQAPVSTPSPIPANVGVASATVAQPGQTQMQATSPTTAQPAVSAASANVPARAAGMTTQEQAHLDRVEADLRASQKEVDGLKQTVRELEGKIAQISAKPAAPTAPARPLQVVGNKPVPTRPSAAAIPSGSGASTTGQAAAASPSTENASKVKAGAIQAVPTSQYHVTGVIGNRAFITRRVDDREVEQSVLAGDMYDGHRVASVDPVKRQVVLDNGTVIATEGR